MNAKTTNKNYVTICIAEDEELNFLFFEEVFADKEVHIIHTRTGDETVDACNNNPEIKLVLMDIKMPGLDGYHAALKIKQSCPELPIIAQTAYVYEYEKQRFNEQVFDDYMTKPIKADELLEKVEQWIKIPKKQDFKK